MLISDMDIFRLMVYVQQVEDEYLIDRDGYQNKKAKTGNEGGKLNSGSSRPLFQKPKGHAPSYASSVAPKN